LAGARAGYNCSDCRKAGLCEVRGCLPGKKAITPYFIDGEEIWKCPVTYNNTFTRQSLSLWAGYRKGYLADPGSYSEQSNLYLEVMEYLEGNQAQYESDEMKRNQNKANRGFKK
jgi:hypothetical protein